MIKLLEVFQITINTNLTDLPEHIANHVYIGGDGFIVKRSQSFSWGDYVVIDSGGHVSGMTKSHIDTIRENGKIIDGHHAPITAEQFADGLMEDIRDYVTAPYKKPDGDYGRKVIVITHGKYPKIIDFELVRDVLKQRNLWLSVSRYESLQLSPIDNDNCDQA